MIQIQNKKTGEIITFPTHGEFNPEILTIKPKEVQELKDGARIEAHFDEETGEVIKVTFTVPIRKTKRWWQFWKKSKSQKSQFESTEKYIDELTKEIFDSVSNGPTGPCNLVPNPDEISGMSQS